MGDFMTNMAAHPTDPNTAYILFSAAGLPKIFRTQDAGQTWASLTGTVGTTDAVSSNGFPNVATYAMLQMPYDPNTIWAGTEIGLVVSSDNGGWTWAHPVVLVPERGGAPDAASRMAQGDRGHARTRGVHDSALRTRHDVVCGVTEPSEPRAVSVGCDRHRA